MARFNRWIISAYEWIPGSKYPKKIDLFTWTRSPRDGIAAAKAEAERRGRVLCSYEWRPADGFQHIDLAKG